MLTAERRRENNDDTKAVSRSRIDRLCRRRGIPLREKTLWRMLYESASRASAVLALNIEDLGLPNKQAKITAKGGDTMWITWGTDTAHLLPRLIAGRERGPLFLSAHRPGPHRRSTTDSRDLCPDTGHVRLGYDRARILLAHYGDGLRLHQLRQSSATHLGEANISANIIMAKTGHKSLRSVQRYVKPGLAAVHQATETLSAPADAGESQADSLDPADSDRDLFPHNVGEVAELRCRIPVLFTGAVHPSEASPPARTARQSTDRPVHGSDQPLHPRTAGF